MLQLAGLWDGVLKLNKSSIDFCRAVFVTSVALPRVLGIFTGEPPILTKAAQLPTDVFPGGFRPPPPADPFALWERTGEPRAEVADEPARGFSGEETAPDEEALATGATCLLGGEEAHGAEVPPRTEPLPLKGTILRMSCNPGPDVQKGRTWIKLT